MDVFKGKSVADAVRSNYLIEEEKQRRQEIENLIAKLETDQKNGLIFTGAIWAWLMTNLNHFGAEIALVVAAVPCLVVLLFFYRWRRIESEISVIAEYIKYVEGYLRLPAGLGWETWIDDKRQTHNVATPDGSRNFWFALIVANFLIAFMFVTYRESATAVEMLKPDLAKQVEKWIDEQPRPRPSIEDAVRGLVKKGLEP